MVSWVTHLRWTMRPTGWKLKLGAAARRRPSWNTRWEAMLQQALAIAIEGRELAVVVMSLCRAPAVRAREVPSIRAIAEAANQRRRLSHGDQGTRKLLARAALLPFFFRNLDIAALSPRACIRGVTAFLLASCQWY